MRRHAIETRKALLAELLKESHLSIVLNEHFDEDGALVYDAACQLGCEGIVSKRLGSPYCSERSAHWVKVKNPKAPAVRREAQEDWVASSLAEMPPLRNPRYRKSNSELLAGTHLGKNGRFFDDADVVQLLREAVDREGSISAFAKRAGLHRVAVNSILNGRRPVSRLLVKALGLRKVYVAE